jgi:transcriptional regulator with XRE-family HTH domain
MCTYDRGFQDRTDTAFRRGPWMFLSVSGTMRRVASDQLLTTLGDAVIARRVALGMKTTVALARRMHMSSRLVSDIENGRRRVGRSAYAALEAALGWRRGSVQYMFRTGEEPSADSGVPPHDDATAYVADASPDDQPAGISDEDIISELDDMRRRLDRIERGLRGRQSGTGSVDETP